MQRKLAVALLELHPPKPSAHGFLRGRSIVTNARHHESQRVVGNLDLKDFFPTIHIGRVASALRNAPYSLGASAATVVAQICTDDAGVLPQGAPSSPIISNIICRSLDEELQQLVRKHGCRYTRYADDITVSTSRPSVPPELLAEDPLTGMIAAGSLLEDAIKRSGFTINADKVRMATADERQEVTGLTVNESCNVARRFVREMDSLIHIWRKFGADRAAEAFARHYKAPYTPAVLSRLQNFFVGKLHYLQMVKGEHDSVPRRLHWEMADLSPKIVAPPTLIAELPGTPLRGFSGRFRGWQVVSNRYASSVKLLEARVGEDIGAGSAFVVDSNMLVTAGHNVAAKVRVYHDDGTIAPSKMYSINVPAMWDMALLLFDGHPFAGDAPFHFQYRLPEIGEEVAAMGYPQMAYRNPDIVLHTGSVEALPTSFWNARFIQTGFQSGGGLSGGPVFDQRGFVLGLMIENVYMAAKEPVEGKAPAPIRPYGQAVPFEYVARARSTLQNFGEAALIDAGFSVTLPPLEGEAF